MTKRSWIGFLVVVVMLGVGVMPANAWSPHLFGARVFIGPGPFWFGYPYYAPPVVVQPSPPVYVQPPATAPAPASWYYCENPKGYYPYVAQCRGGWRAVPSRP